MEAVKVERNACQQHSMRLIAANELSGMLQQSWFGDRAKTTLFFFFTPSLWLLCLVVLQSQTLKAIPSAK